MSRHIVFFFSSFLIDLSHQIDNLLVGWSVTSMFTGLWGVDLMMADLEALKIYADYIQLASRIWSVPLPNLYDSQKVSDYFNCRPHVLAFRIIKVFEMLL